VREIEMPLGLESCHAGGRLDGCEVALDPTGTLAIAAAHPGWDGTPGYSLYALEIE